MNSIKSFEDLECWKKCRIIRKEISCLIKTFPEHEKFDLISQMRRSSRSATYNIAEGFGRFHYKENAQLCRISRGSLFELLDQVNVAFDEEYIDKNKYDSLNLLIWQGIKVLNGYIKYLNKAQINNNPNNQ